MKTYLSEYVDGVKEWHEKYHLDTFAECRSGCCRLAKSIIKDDEIITKKEAEDDIAAATFTDRA